MTMCPFDEITAFMQRKIMSYLETAKSLGRSVGPRVDVVISRPVGFFGRLLARLPKSDQQWFGLDLRFLLLENVRKPVADNYGGVVRLLLLGVEADRRQQGDRGRRSAARKQARRHASSCRVLTPFLLSPSDCARVEDGMESRPWQKWGPRERACRSES